MNREFTCNRDKHRYRSGSQGYRIGKDEERHGFLQLALEADYSWINYFAQARVESQRHDMHIGKEHLVEEPGDITDESEPLAGQIFKATPRYENCAGQTRNDGAGDYPEAEVKEVESSREDDPGGETNKKSNGERDELLDSGGKRTTTLFVHRGKVSC